MTAPAMITFSGTSPCGAVQVNFGDGNVQTLAIGSLPFSIGYAWWAPGTYTVTATGVGGCTGTVSRTFTVEGPPAPEAEIADEITLADGEEGARLSGAVDVEMEPRLAPQATATLTVNLMGTGTGNVASAPAGLSCSGGRGVSCTGTFAVGTVVTFVATPEAGATFGGWGGACGGTGGCQVTVTQASLVVASFIVPPPTVTQYYHLDALGSVRAVTDVNGGLIRRHDYATFGENLDQAGSEPQPLPALAKRQRFTGKEHDGETELTYFGARYYRNIWGRFTSVDPLVSIDTALRDPQRWNVYAYAGNRPTRIIDPDGRGWASALFKLAKTAVKGGNVAVEFASAVEDARTVVNSDASLLSRAWAAASLGSEVFLPISIGDAKSIGAFAVRHADKLGLVGRTALEAHHLLPREFESQFLAAGIKNINDYIIAVPRELHRLLPHGAHTRHFDWNGRWRQFFKDREGRRISRDEILDYADDLWSEFLRSVPQDIDF